jgi:membrane dipeptidase
MQEVGVVLDVSHLADQAVEEALRLWRGPLLASHSNARTLVHGDRQLADETVAEVGPRGGVIGVSFFRKHLRADGRPAHLQDVKRHVDHLARVAGGPEHVGLGTDLDGGFPAADAAIDRLEQLGELRPMLRRRFSEPQVEGIMGGNWVELLRRALPGPDGRLGPAWSREGAEEEPAAAWRRPEGEA